MNRAKIRRRNVDAPGIVLVWLLLAWCPGALALNPSLDVSQYAHTAWKIRDGFTKGTISSITQTPDGYLWLGTEFGLLRFDGVRAVPWQPPPDQHLPSNRIFSLLAARDGTLWIGTSKGLASWNGSQLIQYPELAGQTIRAALLEDHEGTVWAGGFASSAQARLCTIQKNSVHCFGEDGSLGNGVSGLYEDRSHNVWVGVQNGLWRWKPGPPKFYAAAGPTANGGGIQGLADGDDGSILFGALNGTRRLVGDKNEAYPLPTNVQKLTATRMLRDGDGNLWIGTSDGGVVQVHEGRIDLFDQSDGLSGDFITALFADREGTIWIATDGGLDRFREVAVSTLSLNQGLSNASILSVLADRDGSVWLSTRRGLNRWSNGQISIFGKSGATVERTGGGTIGSDEPGGLINGAYVGSMFQDGQGRIWVSTIREFGYLENGLFVSLKSVPGGVVYSITEDTDGDLWIANKDLGLIHLLRGGQVQQIPWTGLGHKDPAMALAVDPLRRGLWVGFHQGGIAYFADGQVRASYSNADGLGQGRVNDLRFDSDGTLWAATEGGLSRLKNDRVATLTTRNGLPCDSIHWAMDDGQSFWLYTTCGLVRVARSELDAWAGAVDKDKDANSAIHATVFDSSEGVRSLEDNGGYTPHVAKSSDGRIWFLPSDGVSVVDPRHIPFNRLPPPVQVEQISADRKSYSSDGGGQLRLPPLVRDLEIDYTALSLIEPEKVLFKYKLEGWDRDWIEAGNRRQAFYSNLPPNNYRFRVIACNNSGVWNETGTYLDFAIAPAYYQTTWFRLSAGVVFLALLFAAYRLRVQHLRRQERKLLTVIDTMPAMTWTARPDGSVDFVNRQWLEYTGLSLEQSAGSGWLAIVHPEDRERHLEKRRASLETGQPFESEVRYRRAADRQYRWFLARLVPLRDAKGKIRKWYGTSTDIEERERLRQLESELAHINRVSMLGELTASLAHEINQPITGTIVNANACLRWLTRDQPDLEEARTNVERIKRDGERAAEIIARLKSFYKKGTPPKRESIDVNEVVDEMLGLLQSEAKRRSVVMRTELAAGLPLVRADRVQLQQVLMNLMLNGIEAMEGAGGALTIRTQVEDAEVLVTVGDTGVGLPAENKDQIFNSFFTTKAHGTGMGLSISRTIIEAHGGRLWASNNNGRGATFHFTLPLQRPKAQNPN